MKTVTLNSNCFTVKKAKEKEKQFLFLKNILGPRCHVILRSLLVGRGQKLGHNEVIDEKRERKANLGEM